MWNSQWKLWLPACHELARPQNFQPRSISVGVGGFAELQLLRFPEFVLQKSSGASETQGTILFKYVGT
jgi:hypothetical protein